RPVAGLAAVVVRRGPVGFRALFAFRAGVAPALAAATALSGGAAGRRPARLIAFGSSGVVAGCDIGSKDTAGRSCDRPRRSGYLGAGAGAAPAGRAIAPTYTPRITRIAPAMTLGPIDSPRSTAARPTDTIGARTNWYDTAVAVQRRSRYLSSRKTTTVPGPTRYANASHVPGVA